MNQFDDNVEKTSKIISNERSSLGSQGHFSDLSKKVLSIPSYRAMQLAKRLSDHIGGLNLLSTDQYRSESRALKELGHTVESASPERMYKHIYALRNISLLDIAALLGSVNPMLGEVKFTQAQNQIHHEYESKVMLLVSALLSKAPCAYWSLSGNVLKIDLKYWKKGAADPVYTLEMLNDWYMKKRTIIAYDRNGLYVR